VAISAFTDWTALALSEDHSCGLRATGALYCWGRNVDGQLGTGGAWKMTPTAVPF
jgi:alpha-tubulin suppressor-like RCC1 family protein